VYSHHVNVKITRGARLTAKAAPHKLARALQALSDPYCQSTCLCVGKFDANYLGN